jgi:hypothetical protein
MRANVAAAEFFPGEAMRLLGLEGIDYAQLRAMYSLARVSRGEPAPGRGWARFTLADLAALEVLVALGGGRESLLRGRRMVLGEVLETCSALRERGFDNPLLQVPMAREGRRILARVDGLLVEPITGQAVLDTVSDRVRTFLSSHVLTDPMVRRAIASERRRMRSRGPRVVRVVDELGTLDGILAN